MANRVHRVGDQNFGGGVILTTPQTSMRLDGEWVSVDGARGTTHANCTMLQQQHCFNQWVTQQGSMSWTIEDKPVNYEGNADSCTHVRIDGSNHTVDL